MEKRLNWNSHQLTRGWQKGVTAFYWGLGFKEEDLDKAQVGIGVPLLDGNLCNMHAHELAQLMAQGCREAGLLGFPFGVPGVSDNITQGMEGGNASLPSRNLIANASECVVSAHCYDAMIGTHHCDKNGPGFAMALARMNVPGLLLSGGSIMPGCYEGRDVTILDAYDAQAAADVGEIPHAKAEAIIRAACPGAGGCGIAASFNTWGITMEAIGLMPPFSSSIPAIDPAKKQECLEVGHLLKRLLETGIRPRDILNRKAFENAATAMAAIGGSTNGVIHLLALAREAKISFSLKDLQGIFRKTPVLCNFAPRGKRTMVDLHRLGGTPLLLKHFLDMGLLDGSCLTVTGATLEENLKDIPSVPSDQDLIAPADTPFKPYADMQICFGNLAPEGMVFKVSSMQSPTFSGSAMCFEDPRAITQAVKEKRLKPGTVVVLRHLGPVASGMPEVLVATSALSVPELDGKVALVSDTRVSGVSHGAIGVHCAPEAAIGGPIGLVEDGDTIGFDLLKGTIDWDVSETVINERRKKNNLSQPTHQRGYLADFSVTVSQAHEGCVSHWVIS